MSDHGEQKLRKGGPMATGRGKAAPPLPTLRQAATAAILGLVAAATVERLGLLEPDDLELEARRLAVELATIHNLCESDASRLDLARLMVARGIRAGARVPAPGITAGRVFDAMVAASGEMRGPGGGPLGYPGPQPPLEFATRVAAHLAEPDNDATGFKA